MGQNSTNLAKELTTVFLAAQFFSSNHNMQCQIQSFNKFSFFVLKKLANFDSVLLICKFSKRKKNGHQSCLRADHSVLTINS